MAQNNFRITSGNLWYSKAGHDSNAGSINEPRKTLVARANTATSKSQWNVVGSGDYALGNFTLGCIIADGIVIISPTGSNTVTLTGSSTSSGNITGADGIYLKNYLLAWVDGFHVGNLYENGFFVNCNGTLNWVVSFTRGFNLENYKIINCSILGTAANSFNYIVCINSNIESRQFRSSYVDADSSIKYLSGAGTFRNNNIQGEVILPITGPSFKSYAIQDQYTGTPQDNGYAIGVNWLTEANLTADGYTGTVAGWDTAVATCINRDPKFNDVSGEDFTLQSDSPHIRRAEDGINNIGGTKIARSVINTDDNATSVFVEPSAEIDTTVPTSYHIEDGETEGTIDYIFDLGSVAALDFIDLKAELKFNSDFAGGTVQNEDVPDSEPLTNDYALKVNTAASATPDLNKIIVPTGLITSGMWVRVAGEAREVTGVSVSSPNDTVTVASNFRAIVGAGVNVTYGTEGQLAALNPNRLTYQLRVSQSATKPTVDSDWDNDLDPSYGESGTFFTQEWGIRPVYAINGGIVYGGGDSERPIGATTQEIEGRWIQVRVYLRNNYSSNGL
jgi:hypothetical protein